MNPVAVYLFRFFRFCRKFLDKKKCCNFCVKLPGDTTLANIVQNSTNLKKYIQFHKCGKVKKIKEGCLDLIPSPSPSVKIQIMGGIIGLTFSIGGHFCFAFVFKSLLTSPSNVLPYITIRKLSRQ